MHYMYICPLPGMQPVVQVTDTIMSKDRELGGVTAVVEDEYEHESIR